VLPVWRGQFGDTHPIDLLRRRHGSAGDHRALMSCMVPGGAQERRQ
jgi:hypothetical protein